MKLINGFFIICRDRGKHRERGRGEGRKKRKNRRDGPVNSIFNTKKKYYISQPCFVCVCQYLGLYCQEVNICDQCCVDSIIYTWTQQFRESDSNFKLSPVICSFSCLYSCNVATSTADLNIGVHIHIKNTHIG
jgi:hypothetical protein